MKKTNQLVNKLKENKGITLIALVITIIVLLILAGVAISSITGNDDIMDKAQNAKVATDNSNEEEEIKMAAVTAMADNMEGLGVLTADKLSKALNNKYPVVDEGDKIKVFAINEYTLDKTGNVKTEGETPKGEFSITSFSYTPNTVSIGGTSSAPSVEISGTPYKGPKYTSSDESKATVDETTGVVTGKVSGEVTITVTYKNYQNVEVTETAIVIVSLPADLTTVNSYREFNYTGAVQTLKVTTGQKYKLEVYGAEGGAGDYSGGKGGYSYGQYIIPSGVDKLFIVVGGTGTTETGNNAISSGGYNGGGTGCNNTQGTGGSGGGATHIASITGLLKNLSSNQNSVIIVAGGGGGGHNFGNGGVGGGDSGGEGTTTSTGRNGGGGTQSSGGTAYTSRGATVGTFGKGGNGGSGYSACSCGGGGGGWYGGGGGAASQNHGSGYGGAGGGGSGYIGGCISGSTGMTSGSRTGNGYAKITLLSN